MGIFVNLKRKRLRCFRLFPYSVENQYDFVVCQAVLRHLDNPSAFIQKMIPFVKPDGHVVWCRGL